MGGSREVVYEIALWAFPAGLIGGRIYFLITTPSQIPHHWWGPFAIWKGGLGIWGGIAGGVAGGLCVLFRRLSRADILRFMDCGSAGAARRAGDRPDRQLLQPGAVRQADDAAVGSEDRPRAPARRATRSSRRSSRRFSTRSSGTCRSRASSCGLETTARSRPPGLFALYVAGYSAFRMFEETLRIDYSNHILGDAAELLGRDCCCASPGCCGSSRSSGGGASRRRPTQLDGAWQLADSASR